MKKAIFYSLLAVFITLQGCWQVTDDVLPAPFSDYEPVIVKRSELENATILNAPQPIVNSGKIYIKDNYLFINERNQGFHIFNNTDPENPVKIAFLQVLGASDIAIKGDILYINNATDLIAVQPNFSDLTVVISKRITNTFPQMLSPDGFDFYDLQEDEIIIDWIFKS